MSDDQPREQFAITTLDEAAMRVAIGKVFPGELDYADLAPLAGRTIEFIELGYAAAFFVGANNLKPVKRGLRKMDAELMVMGLMVPADQHERLKHLIKVAERQMG